jgi:4'-phosphopantetheinyl transferase
MHFDSPMTIPVPWPEPASASILILAARPARFTDVQYKNLVHWLSHDEHARLRNFRFDADRRSYLLAHALTRWMLARCLDEDSPARIPIVREASGKPRLALREGPEFSLSHCSDAVLCAVAYGSPLGVDIEPSSRRFAVSELGEFVYSPPELKMLAEKRNSGQAETTALRWWTIKEAFLKADGCGLQLSPASVCCAADGMAGPGCLKLAPALMSPPRAESYQGAVGMGLDRHWIAWVALSGSRRPRPVYGEWNGHEDCLPLVTSECWHFGR